MTQTHDFDINSAFCLVCGIGAEDGPHPLAGDQRAGRRALAGRDDRRDGPVDAGAEEEGGGAMTALPAGLCWVEAYVARINAAREFLAGIGMAPERADRDALVPSWRVPMWTGPFSNDELVRFAEARGFRG